MMTGLFRLKSMSNLVAYVVVWEKVDLFLFYLFIYFILFFIFFIFLFFLFYFIFFFLSSVNFNFVFAIN